MRAGPVWDTIRYQGAEISFAKLNQLLRRTEGAWPQIAPFGGRLRVRVVAIGELELVDLSKTETPTVQVEYPLSGDLASQGPEGPSSRWWLLLVALVAALLCAPFFRMLFFLGDEGIFLRAAELILQGKKFFVDFFNLSPGATLIIAGWFSLAGISFGSARALAVLVIVGIACFTYLACRQSSRNAPVSALLATGWVMMSVWVWMQISHHWFTTLFSMAAAWAAFSSFERPDRGRRWALTAGAAAGASVMCTPNSGALVVLAAMTAFLNLRQNRSQLIAYGLGCALAPAGVLAILLWQNAIPAGFEDIVISLTGYTSATAAPFGFQASAVNLPLKYVFLLAALLALLVCVYDWRACLSDRRFRLCAAFALAGFVGCYPRPDIWHISYTAPLVLPLLAFCITRLTRSWRPAYRYAAVAGLIGLWAPSVHQFELLARGALRAENAQTPRGNVALYGPFSAQRGLPQLLASIAATPSSEGYFFYPYDEMLPFLTARDHVSKYDLFTPGYTTAAQYFEACRSMIRRASWAVVDRNWTDYNTWKVGFPALPSTEPQETTRFEQALDSAFDLVTKDGTFELRRRREGASDSVCDGINADSTSGADHAARRPVHGP